MKRFIAFLILSALAFSPALAQEKKRVALFDFEYGTVQRWWEGNWDIGKGISDLIVTELVTDGTYRVIERKHLDTILAEQNFSNSDRANSSTAAQIGKVLGVNAMIVGSITQFGTEKKKTGIGGAFGRIGGFGAGNIGTQKGKAKVAIDARMIDIDTGRSWQWLRGQANLPAPASCSAAPEEAVEDLAPAASRWAAATSVRPSWGRPSWQQLRNSRRN